MALYKLRTSYITKLLSPFNNHLLTTEQTTGTIISVF